MSIVWMKKYFMLVGALNFQLREKVYRRRESE